MSSRSGSRSTSTTQASCSAPRSTTSSTPLPSPLSTLFKLVYFVPEEARDTTREAVFEAGGGRIGDYERCSWYTLGEGTFLAREGADPAVGDVGEEERVAEYRVEVIVPQESLNGVVDALRAAHPYEEVAFDLIPLHVL